MSEQLWTDVDHYIERTLIPRDDTLEAALAASDEAGLPAIAVSPALGKLIHLLARANGASRILELGTLGGYSTIWLARALPEGGQLVTLESEQAHAEVARANLDRAGVGDGVEIILGPALETMPTLGNREPFDLVFIDADKEHIPTYFEVAIGLTRQGGVILVDNVVRGGELINEASEDPSTVGVRALHEKLEGDNRVSATTVQAVGVKGHDGLLIAVVN